MIEKSKFKTARTKKKLKIISFDEEIISKDSAEKLLQEHEEPDHGSTKLSQNTSHQFSKNEVLEFKKTERKKRKIDKSDSHQKVKHLKKSKEKSEETDKQITKQDESNEIEENDVGTGTETETTEKPKKESIRSKKRQKHAQLLEEKKIKIELELQQKALNYLSKWKHCRSEWKFEKLRQIWLQQNLFDLDKIPQEFWEIVVEYFSGAKGHSRKVVLDEAVKIVEQEDNSEVNKVKRAQDILQYLQ